MRWCPCGIWAFLILSLIPLSHGVRVFASVNILEFDAGEHVVSFNIIRLSLRALVVQISRSSSFVSIALSLS